MEKSEYGKISKHQKRLIKKLRQDWIEDIGCRGVYDAERDDRGNICGFTNWRAVMTAKLSKCDYELTVRLNERPDYSGLMVSEFEGLSEGASGDVWAHFKNGRVLPWVTTDTRPISEVERNTRAIERYAASLELASYEPKSAAESIFKREGRGDYWQIVFKGQKLQAMRHLAGLTYIRALLENAGRVLTAADLYEVEHPRLADQQRKAAGAGFPLIDEKAIQQVKEHIKATEAELENPHLSEASAREKEQNLLKLRQHLNDTTKAGRPRVKEAKEGRGSRQTVSKSIEKAIETIAADPHGKELSEHLAAGISKGSTLVYSPGIDWST